MNSLLLKKYFLFIVVYFLFVSQNFSQTIENDSLSKNSFKELSEKFYAAKPDSLKAVLYANYYIKKAKSIKDTIELGSGYYRLSDITRDSTYFVNYWNKIIKATKNTKNSLYPSYSYLKKGDFFFHRGDKDIALNNYLLAHQFSIKNKSTKNIKPYILTRLGMLKNRNKDYKKAINLYKESLTYFQKENLDGKMQNEYFSLLLNIASTFRNIKQYDSAFYYYNEANLIAIKYKRKDIIGYTSYFSGEILMDKKNYKSSIDSLKKSEFYIIDDENYTFLSDLYYKIGKSYLKLSNIEDAIINFHKVDSLFNNFKIFYDCQKPTYKYLLEHYKDQKNDVKHLEYINKYITVDSVLNARSKNISKNLTENYDIPNLIAEKEAIEKRLNTKLATSRKYIWLISFISIIISLFLIFQYRKRKLYKERFIQLLEQPIPKKTLNKSTKKEHGIPNETFEKIKQQLSEFELKNQFISRKVSLSYLAKEFETNSKYLSQVINQEKEQSFNNYINQLRIQYTVEKLKFDTTFRKFSIKAIAYEVGFNTTESFSKAFFKYTGIKPSYFIKELDNQ